MLPCIFYIVMLILLLYYPAPLWSDCLYPISKNEEIYGILSGNGKAIIDGEEISLSTGDWLKIAPAAKRQFFASDISGITYICIQVKENSLEHFTAEDAVIG